LNTFKTSVSPGVTMGIIVLYLAYFVISSCLIVIAAHALSRYGRLFLLDALGGDDGPAQGISSLLVTAFTLLAFGFVALTMRTTGDAATARLAIQLLAAKLGEVLLVLGGLYLAGILLLTRIRRRLRVQPGPAASAPAGSPGSAAAPSARRSGASPTDPRTRPGGAAQALWRPAPRKTAL
jgi:hypothetical protein